MREGGTEEGQLTTNRKLPFKVKKAGFLHHIFFSIPSDRTVKGNCINKWRKYYYEILVIKMYISRGFILLVIAYYIQMVRLCKYRLYFYTSEENVKMVAVRSSSVVSTPDTQAFVVKKTLTFFLSFFFFFYVKDGQWLPNAAQTPPRRKILTPSLPSSFPPTSFISSFTNKYHHKTTATRKS